MDPELAKAARTLLLEGALQKSAFMIWGSPSSDGAGCRLCARAIERGSMCLEEVTHAGMRFYFHPHCHDVLMKERAAAWSAPPERPPPPPQVRRA